MSLENAFKRLAIRPSAVCRECRRTLSTSAQRNQQQSATASIAALLEDSSRPQPNTLKPQQQQRQSSPQSSNAWKMLYENAEQATRGRTVSQNRTALRDLQRAYTRRDLESQMPRRWQVGDVYAPHDLTGAESAKWKKVQKKPRPKFDVLDQLRIDPRQHYKNFAIMGEYITEMGKIKSGKETGLRPVNQRRMAKAIRRAMGTGILMPGTHRHPKMIQLDANNQYR